MFTTLHFYHIAKFQEPHYANNSKIYLQPAFKIAILSQVNNLNVSLA